MRNPEKVYWDSSVWIALIKKEIVDGVNRYENSKLILEEARDNKVTIYTSRITIVEVHKTRHNPQLTRDEDDRIQEDFLSHQYIKQIDVDKAVAYHARDLSWEYGLKPCDAIHLASALKVNAEVLHHWDGDFDKVPVNIILSENPLKWIKQTAMAGDNF